MYAKKSNRRRTLSGKRLCAAFSAVAIAATTVGLAPATATVGPAGIAPGINITVFHNIDFVATFGWTVGEAVTVDVIRNGVTIGSAAGPAIDTPDGGALEVNHGPAGVPQDGDCWTGHTPDVRPGDLIRVSGAGTVSEVIVDNITFSGPATENPVNHDIEVRGVAKFDNGSNVPIVELDSGEFRDTSKFRGVPDEVLADPLVDGGFIMRYAPPYNLDRNDNNLDEAARKASLLNSGGHAIGFGHTAPLPDHGMLVDGIADAPGPALGCEGSVSAQDAVTQTNHDVLNVANTSTGNLNVSGVSFDASDVDVTVGTLAPVAATITNGTGGQQTWTASVPMTAVQGLADGNVAIGMMSTRGGTPIAGASKSLMKDTVAPVAAPSASPAPGAAKYVDTQTVSLAAGADAIRYTVDGSDPTASTGTLYSGSFDINPGTTTLKARAVDGAGNAGTMLTGAYNVVQSDVAGAPSLTNARAGNASATVAWATPTFDGHKAISHYLLRVYRGTALVRTINTGLDRNVAVLRLVNGTGYRFAAQAVNARGDGALSARSSMVVPRTVASKPRQVRGNSGAPGGRDTVTATWVAPASNGGSAITSYMVSAQRVRANGSLGPSRAVAVKPARARSANLALASGAYRFKVRAVNGIGGSAWSNLSNRAQSR